MPPEILAFIKATGRFPTNQQDLQAFVAATSQQNVGSFGQVPQPIFSPQMGASGGAPLPFGPTGVSRTFTPELQPAFPSAERRRGLEAAAPVPSVRPDAAAAPVSLGALAPAPIPIPVPGATPATPEAGAAGVPTQATPAAEGIARARLGGGPQGFSFPQIPPPAPPAPIVSPVPEFAPSVSGGGLDLGQFGQILPGIERTGTAEVILAKRAQEEQKRQAQAQLVVSAIGTVLGGGLLGGAVGQARAI